MQHTDCCCNLAFSSCSEQGLFSSCGAWASHRSGFCCFGALAVGYWASVVMVHRLSCPAACGILVPGPGMESVSLALAGEFLTTGPAGGSQSHILD